MGKEKVSAQQTIDTKRRKTAQTSAEGRFRIELEGLRAEVLYRAFAPRGRKDSPKRGITTGGSRITNPPAAAMESPCVPHRSW